MHPNLIQQTLKLAIPVALQSLLVSLLSMSDVFMVTGLGTEAVAAIGLGAKLHFVLIMVMASFGSTVSILVAQYHGRGNQSASRAVLSLGVLAGLLLLIPLSFAFVIYPESVLKLLSQDVTLITLGTDYLRLTFPLLIFTHLIICFESALRARGETVTPLLLSSIAIVLNIALNYLLIHGVGPLPQLGVNGVAIASDIARFTQVFLLLHYLALRKHPFALSNLWLTVNALTNHVRQFLKIALPLAFNFTIWGVGTFVYHGVAAKMGTSALASISLISPIEGLYHSLFFGLVTACSVLIGQNLGRDDFNQAIYIAKRFALFAPLGSLFLGLILLALSPIFLPWLLQPGSEIYVLSSQLLWLMCLTFWIKVLNMTVINGILRAGGDNRFVLYSDIFSMWGMAIPACLLAAFYFELSYFWVYAMVLVEEVVKAVLVCYRVVQKKWLNNLTDSPKALNSASSELAA